MAQSTITPSRAAAFEYHERLGTGAFGEVHKVTRIADGEAYCIKHVRLHDASREQHAAALKEVNMLAAVDHPRVVAYYDSFVERGTLHIVMQLCERGDLHQLLSRRRARALPQQAVCRFFVHALQGLAHLHSLRMLHRDIKSRNLFLSEHGLAIGDLGVARVLGSTQSMAQTLVGTPYYLSPELVEGGAYNAKSDVWALGVVLYELMAAGSLPFTAQNQGALVLRILRGAYEPPSHVSAYSPELLRLLESCLQREPSLRPTTREMLEALSPAALAPAEPEAAPQIEAEQAEAEAAARAQEEADDAAEEARIDALHQQEGPALEETDSEADGSTENGSVECEEEEENEEENGLEEYGSETSEGASSLCSSTTTDGMSLTEALIENFGQLGVMGTTDIVPESPEREEELLRLGEAVLAELEEGSTPIGSIDPSARARIYASDSGIDLDDLTLGEVDESAGLVSKAARANFMSSADAARIADSCGCSSVGSSNESNGRVSTDGAYSGATMAASTCALPARASNELHSTWTPYVEPLVRIL